MINISCERDYYSNKCDVKLVAFPSRDTENHFVEGQFVRVTVIVLTESRSSNPGP